MRQAMFVVIAVFVSMQMFECGVDKDILDDTQIDKSAWIDPYEMFPDEHSPKVTHQTSECLPCNCNAVESSQLDCSPRYYFAFSRIAAKFSKKVEDYSIDKNLMVSIELDDVAFILKSLSQVNDENKCRIIENIEEALMKRIDNLIIQPSNVYYYTKYQPILIPISAILLIACLLYFVFTLTLKQKIRYSLSILLSVSFVFRWYEMYNEKMAERSDKLLSLSEKCSAKASYSWFSGIIMTASQSIKNAFIFSKDDSCMNYHQALYLDPLFAVNPLSVVTTTITAGLIDTWPLIADRCGQSFKFFFHHVPTAYQLVLVVLFSIFIVATSFFIIRISLSSLTGPVTKCKMCLNGDNSSRRSLRDRYEESGRRAITENETVSMNSERRSCEYSRDESTNRRYIGRGEIVPVNSESYFTKKSTSKRVTANSHFVIVQRKRHMSL